MVTRCGVDDCSPCREQCSVHLWFEGFFWCPSLFQNLRSIRLLHSAYSRLWNRSFHVTLPPRAQRISLFLFTDSAVCSVYFNTPLSTRAFSVCHIPAPAQREKQHQKWPKVSSADLIIQCSDPGLVQPCLPATDADICSKHVNFSPWMHYATTRPWAFLQRTKTPDPTR